MELGPPPATADMMETAAVAVPAFAIRDTRMVSGMYTCRAAQHQRFKGLHAKVPGKKDSEYNLCDVQVADTCLQPHVVLSPCFQSMDRCSLVVIDALMTIEDLP